MKECFMQDWHIDAGGQMEQTREVDVLSKHTLKQNKTFLFFCSQLVKDSLLRKQVDQNVQASVSLYRLVRMCSVVMFEVKDTFVVFPCGAAINSRTLHVMLV